MAFGSWPYKYLPMSKEAETTAKIEILEAELITAQKEIKALNTELKTLRTLPSMGTKKAPPANLPGVKIGGKNYKFLVPAFIFESKRYTATEAAKDKKLCERLIDLGINVLQTK